MPFTPEILAVFEQFSDLEVMVAPTEKDQADPPSQAKPQDQEKPT